MLLSCAVLLGYIPVSVVSSVGAERKDYILISFCAYIVEMNMHISD